MEPLILDFFAEYSLVEIDREVLLQASKLRGEYSFSYYDSIIVASALSSEAEVIYTEDMQHGLLVRDRLKIINPFKSN